MRISTNSPFIRKLSADLVEHCLEDDFTVTAEDVFRAKCEARQDTAHRNGWPDFLVEKKDGSGFYFVEVKGRGDSLQPSQKRMFAALERAGIPVYVWEPMTPTRLIPWRRFRPTRNLEGRRPKS